MGLFGKKSESDREGIYVYRGGEWVKTDALEIPEGLSLIYFDNLKCPFCKVFDVVWDTLVEDPKLRGFNFIKVVCTFFENNCSNPASKRAFHEHGVDRSPMVLMVKKDAQGGQRTEVLLPSEHGYDYKRIRDAILRFASRQA